jgi:hypothetical protein
MMKKQMVKGEAVVLAGKVRGFLYTAVLSDGTVYRRFVPRFTNKPMVEAVSNVQQLHVHEDGTRSITKPIPVSEVPADILEAAAQGTTNTLAQLLEPPVQKPISIEPWVQEALKRNREQRRAELEQLEIENKKSLRKNKWKETIDLLFF